MSRLQQLLKLLDTWVIRLAMVGAVIVIVQAVWITYGVFKRYVLNSPDGTVTEATALLLVPVAFVGLAYALKEDAYPRVTIIQDLLPLTVQRWLVSINLLIMTLIGAFLSIAATSAFLRALKSGASSEILLWPRFYFWFAVAFSLTLFTLYALLKCLQAVLIAKTAAPTSTSQQEAP